MARVEIAMPKSRSLRRIPRISVGAPQKSNRGVRRGKRCWKAEEVYWNGIAARSAAIAGRARDKAKLQRSRGRLYTYFH